MVTIVYQIGFLTTTNDNDFYKFYLYFEYWGNNKLITKTNKIPSVMSFGDF